MPTQTPSRSARQRSGAARGNRKSQRIKSGAKRRASKALGPAAASRSAGKSRPRSATSSASQKAPTLEVIAAVREELEQLGRRWKNLLPRLQRVKTTAARGTRSARPAKRRARR